MMSGLHLTESMMEHASDRYKGGPAKSGVDLESGNGVPPPPPPPKPVVSSPLGETSPAAPARIFSQALGIIVGFFAEEWLEAILGERQGLEILLIFILILILWMSTSDWIQGWWATPMREDKRLWSQGWVLFVHFVSYALTLVVFRYVAVIFGEEWSRQGLGIGEGILHGILFFIYFFFLYLYFLQRL